MSPQQAKTKSTGPRTEVGKRTSSQNSLRHGLASGTILIPGEDPASGEFASQQEMRRMIAVINAPMPSVADSLKTLRQRNKEAREENQA